MKRSHILLILLLVIINTACYDDFRVDYEETTIAFSTATGAATADGVLNRTVVLGEGLHFNYGVFLGGVIENDVERWADFIIDPSLLEGTSYDLLPEEYYTLSHDSRFTIPKGEHVGPITIELDSTQIVNDEQTMNFNYAIPFRIVDTSEDNINESQSTKIVAVKYINHYEGSYDHSGTYTTFDESGDEINSGSINNVIDAVTTGPESVRLNGVINQRGLAYQADVITGDGQNVSLEYYPNPNPPEIENVALESSSSTSHVSPWESIDPVNDGYEPQNSNDNSQGLYGNWPEGVNWQWVQYDLPGVYDIETTELYWFTDGGGLIAATDSYIEYLDEDGQWVEIPNSHIGSELNQWNEFTPNESIRTNAIRINFIGDESVGGSVGIIEWRVWGWPVPNTPEQSVILNLAESDGSSFNASTSSYQLDYRVNFENGNYTLVSSEMVWRNRIRDGVNEWRR